MHIIYAGRAVRLLVAVAVCASLIAPAGAEPTFKTLYRFKGGHDGATPIGPLVADKGGVLYGVTYKGGANDWGTVFMLTPSVPPETAWKKTILHHFCAPNDGCGPMAGLTLHRGRLYGTAFYQGRFGGGLVFRLSPPANDGAPWKYEVLHDFKGTPDGYDPLSKLVIDDDGALYGFTYGDGGGVQAATLYKVAPARRAPWPEEVLHSFADRPDGDEFNVFGDAGIPILHPNGAIMTTSSMGGATRQGVVFQFMPGGTQPQIVYDFAAGGGQWPYAGVVSDDAGIVYGTTSRGGAQDGGAVYKLSPPTPPSTTWTFSKLHDLPAQPGGGFIYGSVVVLNERGNLFGAVSYGGSRDVGYVYRLAPPADGPGPWRSSVLYNFRGGANGARPSSVTLGRGGVLYGITTEGGTACNCGTVFMIEP